MPRPSREPLVLLALALALLAVSGVGCYDALTWVLEVLPIVLAVPLLLGTGARFPLTPLLYRLLFLHALILMVGGHYTYARVPLGFWAADLLGLARNHYDRLGHFAQGFVPAVLVRELLLRLWRAPRGKLLFAVVALVCAGVSACYEFLEWWAALAFGGSADAFLATQGDVWDTQWDMFLALVGAVSAQLLLGGLHGRQLARLMPEGRPGP